MTIKLMSRNHDFQRKADESERFRNRRDVVAVIMIAVMVCIIGYNALAIITQA